MKKLICLLLALVMMMAMVACGNENKEVYEAAVAAYNSGYYAEAAEKLAALGDYKDAAQLLASISAEVSGATVETVTADGTVTTDEEYTFQKGNLVIVQQVSIDRNDRHGTLGLCSGNRHLIGLFILGQVAFDPLLAFENTLHQTKVTFAQGSVPQQL